MQPAELRQQRTIHRSGLDRPHLHPQHRHLRANHLLRHHRKQNHRHHEERRRRSQTRKRSRPHQSRHQERNPAYHSHQMHPPETKTNNRPSRVSASQDPKRPRRHHKAQKHIAPQPQAQSQEFKRTQQVRHAKTIQDSSNSGHRMTDPSRFSSIAAECLTA